MLNLICDVCDKPIRASQRGYLCVSYDDFHQAEDAVKAWETANPGPAYSGDALLSHPEPAHWHILHAACDPAPDGNDYWRKTRTLDYPALLRFTAHIMGKRWFEYTDWDDVLVRIAAITTRTT